VALQEQICDLARAANRALYTIALVRMPCDARTRDYVRAQRAKGRTQPEILRLLKRAIAREVFMTLTRGLVAPELADLRPARQAKNITLRAAATAIEHLSQQDPADRTRHLPRLRPGPALPRVAQRRVTARWCGRWLIKSGHPQQRAVRSVWCSELGSGRASSAPGHRYLCRWPGAAIQLC
jgi:hypothetical protein